jgi:ABC-type multidrug transport system fused ATPase/permease subunit
MNLPTYADANTVFKFENKTIADIIGGLLPYIYVIAGLLLLLMLISGGIALMTSAGNPDKSKAGYGKITGALIGFIIVFVSYFIAKIAETILGVKFM